MLDDTQHNGVTPPQDETTNEASATAAPQGSQAVAPIIILTQYVKDVSFENPRILDYLQTPEGHPSVDISVHIDTHPMTANTFEVTVTLSAKAHHGEKLAFMAQVSYAGVFMLNGIPEESVQLVLLIECPRLLFPFLRNIIADLSRESGYAPLLIQPIDFADLYRQELMRAAAAAEAEAPADSKAN